MESNLKQKYTKLQERYKRLKKKYSVVQKITLHREHIKRKVFDNYFFITVTIIGVICLIFFRSQIAIELGLLCVVFMLFHELTGTKKGWWDYKGRKGYKICGRVPIHLVATYFFSTVVLVTYIIFRMGAI